MQRRGFARNAPLALLAVLGLKTAAPALAGPAEKLPADVVFVIDVDVAGIVKSDLYKKHSEKLFANVPAKQDPDYLKFKEVTGFNPETDLQSVVIGLAGDAFGGKPTVYAVAAGSFDQGKFDDYAKNNDKMTVGSQEGVTTYTANKSGEGAPPIFALLDKNTMIVAETPNFAALLASAKGTGASLKSHPKLGSLISKAGAGQVRMAMVLPDQAKEQLKAQPQMAPLANIQAVDMSLNATSGMDLSIEATADTPENGKAVYDTVNGLIAMGKMSSGQNPDMAKIMNALKLEQVGNNNKLTLTLTAEDVDKIVAMIEAQASGAGAAPASGAGAASAPPPGGEATEEPPASTTPQPQR
jgi:hypothetical protein